MGSNPIKHLYLVIYQLADCLLWEQVAVGSSPTNQTGLFIIMNMLLLYVQNSEHYKSGYSLIYYLLSSGYSLTISILSSVFENYFSLTVKYLASHPPLHICYIPFSGLTLGSGGRVLV